MLWKGKGGESMVVVGRLVVLAIDKGGSGTYTHFRTVMR